MERLTELEVAILDSSSLAITRFCGLFARRRIGRACGPREFTGVGVFCDLDVPWDVPSLSSRGEFHLEDVNASMDGLQHGAGFVLLVREGRLATLDRYTYEKTWPDHVVGLRLSYQQEPRLFDEALAELMREDSQ